MLPKIYDCQSLERCTITFFSWFGAFPKPCGKVSLVLFLFSKEPGVLAYENRVRIRNCDALEDMTMSMYIIYAKSGTVEPWTR